MRKLIITLLFVSGVSYAGLQRSENLDIGITADFWDIGHIIIDYDSNQAEVNVLLYKDKAAKDAGSKPIKNKLFRFPIPLKLQDKSDIFTKLKTLPEFQGSIDQ